jgi:hypothetical protein
MGPLMERWSRIPSAPAPAMEESMQSLHVGERALDVQGSLPL